MTVMPLREGDSEWGGGSALSGPSAMQANFFDMNMISVQLNLKKSRCFWGRYPLALEQGCGQRPTLPYFVGIIGVTGRYQTYLDILSA
jgi:hypothetical protein